MKAPPNILILHCDQMRYDALGCDGNPFARTPHIDALAASGTVFTRHIASNPVCMPSRASLLTGLYVPGHNVWRNGVPLQRHDDYGPPALRQWPLGVVTASPVTLPDLFAAAGYDTVSFGKLHLTPNTAPAEYGFGESFELFGRGALADWHGPYYGFRYVDITCGHGEEPCLRGHYADWLRARHPDIVEQVRAPRPPEAQPVPTRRGLYASPVPADLHHSVWLADRLADYLATRDARQPFFAFVGFPDPHHAFTPSFDLVPLFAEAPVRPPADPTGQAWQHAPWRDQLHPQHLLLHHPSAERDAIIRYTYAMVHNIDRAVGRIVAALRARGLWDNTIIIFTSDHGDFLGDHGLLLKTLVGCDSLLHVPFILRAPEVNLPARVATPMSNCDVLPTLTALAGLTAPPHLHGRDILPVVRSGADHVALAHCFTGHVARNNFTIYDADYRLTWYPGADYVEIFDHRTDPAEIHNLAGQPAVAARQAALQQRIMEATFHQTNPMTGRFSERW